MNADSPQPPSQEPSSHDDEATFRLADDAPPRPTARTTLPVSDESAVESAATPEVESQPPVEPPVIPTGPRVVQYRLPFVRGVLDFPWHWRQWPFLVGLSVALAFEGSFVAHALEAMQASKPGQGLGDLKVWIGAFGSTMLMIVAGAALFIVASSYFLRVAVQTAAGADRNITWSGFTWFDWLTDALVVALAAMFSSFPGLASRWVLQGAGIDGSALVPLLAFLCFPLFVLSMLESNAVTGLFSWPIWRSLWLCGRYWGGFYLMAAALLGTVALGTWLLGLIPGRWGWPAISVLMVAGAMMYARLLGRVTWYIPQSRLLDDDEDDEDDDEPQEDEAGNQSLAI